MGRSVDQDVHAAFIEFRAKDDDKVSVDERDDATISLTYNLNIKCLSVQCIYCHQTRAKNTSRQKQHLLECTGNPSNHANAIRAQASPGNGIAAPNGYTTPSGPSQNALPGSAATLLNGGTPQGTSLQTPLPNMAGRPALSQQGANPGQSTLMTPARATPTTTTAVSKTPKAPKANPATGLPAPPLDDVHAAFVEFRAKDEDKVGFLFHTLNLSSFPRRDPLKLYNSVYLSNACFVNKCEQKTRADKDSTSKSVPITSLQ